MGQLAIAGARGDSQHHRMGTDNANHVRQREELARVANEISRITPALAERLDGRLHLTGPFGWPRILGEDARQEFARSRVVLEKRLLEIAPDAFVPDPTLHDLPVIAGEPWIYLEWALGGKVMAIAGRDLLDPVEVERRERPWRVLFG